jgi:hypothetical protein
MDSNLVVAIVTSVCTAGSTAGVAIVALMLSNKRMDRIEAALDRMTASVDSRLEMLTGSMHDIDKRLSIIEDRVGRSN